MTSLARTSRIAMSAAMRSTRLEASRLCPLSPGTRRRIRPGTALERTVTDADEGGVVLTARRGRRAVTAGRAPADQRAVRLATRWRLRRGGAELLLSEVAIDLRVERAAHRSSGLEHQIGQEPYQE